MFGQVGTIFTSGVINYKITATATVEVGQNSLISGVVIIPATVTYNSTTYQVKSIGLSAFQYCSGLTSVTIPNSVTSIGNYAFSSCHGLTSLTLPNSVTSISDYAFTDCTGLTSVIIPNSVTNIGRSAFSSCSSLTSVTIPNSVTLIDRDAFLQCSSLRSIALPNSLVSIGRSSFQNCTSLTSIIIPNSVTSIGDEAFFGCSSSTTLSISTGVTSIGIRTFSSCNRLTSVNIPSSVSTISQAAFANCTGLTSITIPTSVTSIGESAFQECFRLLAVTIPSSVTSIGDYAFSNCSGLTTVSVSWTTPLAINAAVFNGLTLSTRTLNVPAGRVAVYNAAAVWTDFNPIIEQIVAPVINQTFAANGINYIVTKATVPYEVAVGSNTTFVGAATIPAIVSNAGNSFAVTSIGDSAFRTCSSLTSVTIPNSVISIGSNAFENCTGLTSVTIPNSVTSIGFAAFSLCINLTSVNMGNSVTNIKAFAFGSCYFLSSIMLPNSVTNIGEGAFIYSGLTSVTIPDSVVHIGDRAFNSCYGLTSITIGNSVTSIGLDAFNGCSSLTSVIIPNSLKSIGYYAFRGCTGLTSVSIPNSVIDIGDFAFSRCTSLTSVTIPNSVTSIGGGAFESCSGLTSVSIPNSVTNIGGGAFSRCTSLTSVTIPNSVISIGIYAFDYCTGLASVSIGNSVMSIGGRAFAGCTGLTSMTIPDSVTSIGENAFNGCSGLTSVTVNWIFPLYINANVFSGLNLSNITLNVPAGRIVVYDVAAVWTNFGTFIEYTAVPDANFEQALFDLGIDTFNGDQKVLSSAISVITDLDVSNKGIADLSGITDFVNLQSLNCEGNQLSSLDLRGLVVLSEFNSQFNPLLTCISVDDVTFATNNYLIDATTSFSTSCFGNSTVIYCKGAVATPLNAFGAVGSALKWYTTATGGTASLIAPTPSTTTVGTKKYYVSQVVAGIESARETITVIVNALPATPGTITTSDAVLCKYIGTTNEVTYTVPAVAGTTYNWSTPAGANLIADASATDNSITVNFLNAAPNDTSVGGIGTISVSAINSFGCSSSAPRSLVLTSKLPTAPASLTLASADTTPHFNLRDVGSDPATFSFVGLNALAKITKVGPYMDTETVFTLIAPAAATAASYAWTLPAGVNPIGDVTGNVITVDFAGVAPGIGTLPIAVQSVGGCGQSVTPRTLNLTRVLPTAPTALVLTESPSGTALTRVSPYTGKTTELTLTATPVLVQGATATSYAWILPTGVNCITPNTPTIVKQSVNTGTFTPEGAPIFEIRDFAAISTGTVSTITIDFADVAPETLSFPLTVFAVNGAGNSRARTRVVTAAVPTSPAITAVGGTTFNNCNSKTYSVLQTPGTSYTWTVPAGAQIVGATNGNVIVVDYSATSVAVNVSSAVTCFATNGTGNSVTKSLTVKRIACTTPAPRFSDVTEKFSVVAFPNPSSTNFNLNITTSSAKNVEVKVYDMIGKLINKMEVSPSKVAGLQIGDRYPSGVYNVTVSQGTEVKTLRVIKK